MRIGELSERTGASVRSLRHYEQRGLITARRTTGNYRDFAPETVDAVAIIRTLIAAGINTATIERLLPCVALVGGRATPCADLRTELEVERDRLEQCRAQLDTSLDILSGVIAAAEAAPVG
ncbi:MerR family transcriptional regulator [Flexivirga sp. B27]